MPLISFCLSTYKRGEILKSTLESIRRQNFEDYEVIVSDNDVEESGRAVLEQMNDTRFKYFANKENLGMKPSFNKSLERSSGEYIVMMADDDPVYFDMASSLIKLSEQFPEYGMYMGGCDWFCTNAEIAKLYKLNIGTNSCLSNEHDLNFVKAYTADEFLLQFFLFGIFPHYLWSTCIVRRNILIGKGGIPDYGTPFLGDYAYLPIMASYSGCVVINKPLGCQTLHAENFGRNQNEQIITAAKNYPKYVSERLNHLPSWQMIEKRMLNFTGLWVVTHLAFLCHYFKRSKEKTDLSYVEREIFKIDFMKKHKLKYFIKTHSPFLHDQIVSLKKKIK
ncbi:MAG: glycosyltransferase family 2 protein [Chitinophagaceae bacterium]|nr:glycosyltransferase family 2 protein [Chitinophagaceae bacterium]MDB5223980.1 glycosyltransferase family 2 protein [Chitinophagaceae bacterium]